MKKILFLAVVLFAVTNLAYAVAIDDAITPQNCERSNPACAQFMDTTSLGQIKWGGLIAGGLRSLTNLFVDGKLGVGTLRPSTGEQVLKVDVEGAVGAKFYCDENGNHCVAGDSLGTGDGANVVINNGLGINITNQSTNNFTVSIDPTVTQKRVTGVCDNSSAIKKINENGTVECQSVSGNDGGDQLWQTSTTNSSNIYNRNAGNVGVGVNNPTAKLEVVGVGLEKPIVKITDSRYGNYAWLGLNGGGGEFYGIGTGPGVYAHAEGNKENTTGLVAMVDPAGSASEVYGAKLISDKVGTYLKGNIALYATDMAHANSVTNTYGVAYGNRISPALLADSRQWAGYFDGNVNINGDLNINGAVTVNGQPISQGACAVCISAYDNESNTWSTWKCSGADGAESEGTGFSGSKSIEKVKVKMQCD